jgi:hypothetical protein
MFAYPSVPYKVRYSQPHLIDRHLPNNVQQRPHGLRHRLSIAYEAVGVLIPLGAQSATKQREAAFRDAESLYGNMYRHRSLPFEKTKNT